MSAFYINGSFVGEPGPIIHKLHSILDLSLTDHASGSWDDAWLGARSVHGTHSFQSSAVRRPNRTLESVLSVGKFGSSFLWFCVCSLVVPSLPLFVLSVNSQNI